MFRGTFSMLLYKVALIITVRKTAKSMFTSLIPRLPMMPKLYSGDTGTVSYMDEIVVHCRDMLSSSYQQFAMDNVGRDKEGSWIIQEKFVAFQRMIEAIDVERNTAIVSTLQRSPWPLWLNCTCADDAPSFEMTVLAAPAGQALEPRLHPAGTILLYKLLYGNGRMRSFIKSREIKKEDLDETLLIRLAGLSRVFESTAGEPAAVLEVALYPPRRVDEGFGSFSGFTLDSLSKMCQLSFDQEEIKSCFKRKEEDSDSTIGPDITRTRDYSVNVLSQLRDKVGGVAPELSALVRRILCSRQLPSETMKALGLSHTRGLLLYGPPGTGKTLIARELANALNATEPKIVNGPEILSKYVGEAESNIRALFLDAEEEWKIRGPESALHVIIFDELDSIARSRGNAKDGTGIRDSCVNQLLSKIDGAKEINNFLVIGLTNRKDLIDPALLRPGRFEVHLKIGLPDELGRKEILEIVMRPLLDGQFMEKSYNDKWIGDLAKRTSGWSGADLAGLVRDATSHALHTYLENLRSDRNERSWSSQAISIENESRESPQPPSIDTREERRLQLTWEDFERAQREMQKAK